MEPPIYIVSLVVNYYEHKFILKTTNAVVSFFLGDLEHVDEGLASHRSKCKSFQCHLVTFFNRATHISYFHCFYRSTQQWRPELIGCFSIGARAIELLGIIKYYFG